MRKTIDIGGRMITFAASADTPREYRRILGRDALVDMQTIMDEDAPMQDKLEVLECLAYIMAREAGSDSVPETVEDWLKGIDGIFSIWMAQSELMDLWGLNIRTTAKAKKKSDRSTEA